MKIKVILLLILSIFFQSSAAAFSVNVTEAELAKSSALTNTMFAARSFFLSLYIANTIKLAVDLVDKNASSTAPLGRLPKKAPVDPTKAVEAILVNGGYSQPTFNYSRLGDLSAQFYREWTATIINNRTHLNRVFTLGMLISIVFLMVFYLLPRGAIDYSILSTKYRIKRPGL